MRSAVTGSKGIFYFAVGATSVSELSAFERIRQFFGGGLTTLQTQFDHSSMCTNFPDMAPVFDWTLP